MKREEQTRKLKLLLKYNVEVNNMRIKTKMNTLKQNELGIEEKM